MACSTTPPLRCSAKPARKASDCSRMACSSAAKPGGIFTHSSRVNRHPVAVGSKRYVVLTPTSLGGRTGSVTASRSGISSIISMTWIWPFLRKKTLPLPWTVLNGRHGKGVFHIHPQGDGSLGRPNGRPHNGRLTPILSCARCCGDTAGGFYVRSFRLPPDPPVFRSAMNKGQQQSSQQDGKDRKSAVVAILEKGCPQQRQ